ncbi:S41 family peptidase [Streptomyces uncialis]|uniref:S41 family peptidase n=1 Tax=Streptomyces uncialis TaxID=1048205 RepID=UPI002252FB36|nr:S41 family peptidase [Streptomyces uncialis]MCX4663797.1 PDZ domain-containing protein [Streptomyces uncialis]
MTQSAYFRYPHVHGELIAFTAEDDVWIAPLDGGRAWRVSADNVPVSHPRISPDGTTVAWTSTRDGAPEIHVAPVDGGPSRRLTHWGGPRTTVRGWTPDGRVLALGAHDQASTRRSWARAVPLDGGPAETLPYGPVGDAVFGPGGRTVLLSAPMGREAAWWKRYRGGTAGKLWIDRDGDGEFVRFHEDLDGNIEYPLQVGERVAFLSDHEGVGALYSSLADGTDLRRHTPVDGFYARHAATDGTRVIYTSAGQLLLLDSLDDVNGAAGSDGPTTGPRPLTVRLGGQRTDLQPHPVSAARWFGAAAPDHTGRGSALAVRGAVHWVTHREGPARALAAEPGVRARLPRTFRVAGEEHVVWVTDAEGEDALEFIPATGTPDATGTPSATGASADAQNGTGTGTGTGTPNGDATPNTTGTPDGDATPDADATRPDKAPGATADATPQAAPTPDKTTTTSGPETTPDPPTEDTTSPAQAAPRRIARGQLGRVVGLAMAPDGGRAAVAAHDGRVLLVERTTGEVREIDSSEYGDASGLTFSPDSAWLAWSHPGPGPLRQLKLAHTADGTVTEATPLRFQDHSPAFTADGRHLAFLSARAFDPVYDEHVFDLAFVESARPHLITLAATTPSPFGPQRHGRPFETPDKDETPDSEGAPATRIDLEGLADRIVPFPVEAGRYSTLRAAKDGVLWLRHPVVGVLGATRATPDDAEPKTELERYDLVQRRVEHLAGDADHYAVSGDGKRVLLWTDGKLKVVPSDRRAPADEDGDSNLTVDLSRVRQQIDPAAEWRQMYAEAGRLMRDNFWRPDLGGVDWDGVLDRYRPVLDRIATHDDLVDLLWEVQGELGTSHAYVIPSGGGWGSSDSQGLLGADLTRHADGRWRIDRVLPSETSDPRARSPLAAPGVAVRVGDAVVAVGGRPVDPVTGPAPLLAGTAGKPVELTVLPGAGGEPRHVVVVPLDDEEPLRYHAWVTDRRAHVTTLSGGRLGYLHVPDMMAPGWAQIHRDLRVEVTREGLIVDVRENRGGHTSQLVVEKLARRIVGWDLPRGQAPTSYPQDAPRGPVVAVANEFSGSDGDIVNAAIKALGIGPVVGTRTWGGVVGIDSRYRLVDGTLVTQPKYAFWLDGYGWEVENHGVDPDVEVAQTPQDHAAGRDPQLDEAVRIALASLAERPARTPPQLP